MDLSFDSMFESYTDPTFFCGSLNCSRTYLQDRGDANKFVSFVAECAEQHSIREFVVRNSRLGVLDDSQFDRFLRSVSYMTHLSIVRVQSCGLQPHRLQGLIFTILSLPTIKGTALEYPFELDSSGLIKQTKPIRATSELNLRNNCLNDSSLRDLAMMNGGSLKESPLLGVEKLVLSDNDISDKAFRYLVILFPSVQELHLSNCSRITGSKIKEVLLSYFPKLEVLNLDRTSVSHEAILGLLAVMEARRKNEYSPPLEVWIRGIAVVDDSWRELLKICESKGSRSRFTIKHDLQKFCGEKSPRIEHSHEVVKVKVCFSGMHPITVEDYDVMATTSTVKFVKRVIDDINAMSIRDASDSSTVKIRPLYREAFQCLLDSGKLRMRMFKAESATMFKTNIYDNSFTEVDAIENPDEYSALIGPPAPGIAVSFDITVCEDEEKSRTLLVR